MIQKHITDIRTEGKTVLFRKLRTGIGILTLWPLIIAVRLIRPVICVRFGQLINERIGHFAENTELYLCERDAKMHPKNSFDVFHYGSRKFCNMYLKKMWERTGLLRICQWSRYLFILNNLLPGRQRHIIQTSNRDIHNLYGRTPVHLSFTPEEEKMGCEELAKIGVPAAGKFICFQNRDSSYLNLMHARRDYSYHDYRDSDVHDLIPALEQLAMRGYFGVRMGAVVNEHLTTENAKIVDYAVTHRTEFMDIYLSAKCSFFLNAGSGMEAVPIIFRRPVARVNVIPLEYVPTWNTDIFIPKKLWLAKEHRFMTFREIMESGAGRFLESWQYTQSGIEIVNNTPDEIAALVIEMDDRMEGRWQTTAEDEELQQRFQSIFKSSDLHGVVHARIGSRFLRENMELLK